MPSKFPRLLYAQLKGLGHSTKYDPLPHFIKFGMITLEFGFHKSSCYINK